MIYRNCITIVVFLSISFPVRIQSESNEIEKIDLDKIKEQIDFEKIKEQLPKNVEIPASLQNVTLPSVDELTKILKEKCAKVSGGDAAYEAIERGAEELKECTSGLIDVEQLQKEIQEAEPHGELDTVFNKYCGKRDIATGCMENFTAVLEPCLEEKEIEGKRTFVRIIKNLLNFVCHKEGDQIALFIAEKGPECFDQRKDELITCINSTLFDYLPSENNGFPTELPIPTELPELVMGQKQCDEMDLLQICAVKSLEKCQESTPANLVESMFKFVRKETPCANMTSTVFSKQASLKDASGGTSRETSSVLIASLMTFMTFIAMRVTV